MDETVISLDIHAIRKVKDFPYQISQRVQVAALTNRNLLVLKETCVSGASHIATLLTMDKECFLLVKFH